MYDQEINAPFQKCIICIVLKLKEDKNQQDLVIYPSNALATGK